MPVISCIQLHRVAGCGIICIQLYLHTLRTLSILVIRIFPDLFHRNIYRFRFLCRKQTKIIVSRIVNYTVYIFACRHNKAGNKCLRQISRIIKRHCIWINGIICTLIYRACLIVSHFKCPIGKSHAKDAFWKVRKAVPAFTVCRNSTRDYIHLFTCGYSSLFPSCLIRLIVIQLRSVSSILKFH